MKYTLQKVGLATGLGLVGMVGGCKNLRYEVERGTSVEVNRGYDILNDWETVVCNEYFGPFFLDQSVVKRTEKVYRYFIVGVTPGSGTMKSRELIEEREVFPDGRVNVLWDPENKYKSTGGRQ